MATMTEVIKGTFFKWTPKAQIAFEEVKSKLTQAPVLTLPCFDKDLKLSVMHLKSPEVVFLIKKESI